LGEGDELGLSGTVCERRSSGDETEKNKRPFIEMAALKTVDGGIFFKAFL